jgi:hypothetical protein
MKPLEHLLDPAFDDFDDIDAPALMGAQANTAHWLDAVDPAPTLVTDAQKEAARSAFAAVTTPALSDAEKKKALATLRVPNAVKHLAGMLSEYDWEFVEQAKEMRSYVVAKLLEETKHPDARIRLQALKALGTVTEVGAFTERIEVRKIDATADELQERLRAKLSSLLPKVVEVETLTPKE